MPHMFINRKRIHDLTRGRSDLRAQFRWETINAVVYKVGGLVFIIGSILFFPRFEAYADIGAWTFFVGSLLYLVVTVHDLLEVRQHWRNSVSHDRLMVMEYIAASSYVWGTILFTAGSIFFLSAVGWFTAGAWSFIVGSLLFVLGASINVLQIIKAENLVTMQLMNLTALTFVVASVPYLWEVKNPTTQTTLYTYLAWQYLIGSTLFFAGGVFNYWRAYLVMRASIECRGR